jgi:hypothetical protein
VSALEKMREAFETCTVMAGVEPDFECIYITKDAANALFNEAEAENVKLRELVDELYPLADYGAMDASELDRAHDLMHELGIEVD